jgi:hypothetical protein
MNPPHRVVGFGEHRVELNRLERITPDNRLRLISRKG